MIRLFGGFLIFIVSTYCGFSAASRLRRRSEFLKAISDALTYVISEIEFSHTELREIFSRADISGALADFFKSCRDELATSGIREAWEKTVHIKADELSLKECDKDALLQLGVQLGKSDIDGQKKAIGRTVAMLDGYKKSAEEEYVRLSKPYRSCGILLGVFVLLIII